MGDRLTVTQDRRLRKGEGGEGEGRVGKFGGLLPRLRRAAALLSGRRGGERAKSRPRGKGVARCCGSATKGGDQREQSQIVMNCP